MKQEDQNSSSTRGKLRYLTSPIPKDQLVFNTYGDRWNDLIENQIKKISKKNPSLSLNKSNRKDKLIDVIKSTKLPTYEIKSLEPKRIQKETVTNIHKSSKGRFFKISKNSVSPNQKQPVPNKNPSLHIQHIEFKYYTSKSVASCTKSKQNKKKLYLNYINDKNNKEMKCSMNSPVLI